MFCSNFLSLQHLKYSGSSKICLCNVTKKITTRMRTTVVYKLPGSETTLNKKKY